MAERKRNSNIELLRIISMLGVVALHYVRALNKYASNSDFIWYLSATVRSIAVPLVNVFILITGYYMVEKKEYSYRKPINILMIVFFYGIISYFINLVICKDVFSLMNMVKSIFPFFFGSSWFIKTYLILYLLIPFLNKVLQGIDLRGYRRLIIIEFLLFSVWYSVGLNSPVLDKGYGILNFILLYIVGGYIKKYKEKCELLVKLSSNKCIIGYLICVVFTLIASMFFDPFGYAFFSNILGAGFLLLLAAKVKSQNNLYINSIAQNAFDVFFTHEKIFNMSRIDLVVTSPMVVPHMVITVIISYFFGCACGLFRTLFFRHTVDKWWDKVGIINSIYRL